MSISSVRPDIISSKVTYRGDPTLLFQQLCADRSATLLLESAEIVSKNNLNSLMIIDSALRLSCVANQVTIDALTNNGSSLLTKIAQACDSSVKTKLNQQQLILTFPQANFDQQCDENQRLQQQSVFDSLRNIFACIQTSSKDANSIMLAGLFSYDLIEQFEPIEVLKRKNKCPDFCFYLPEILLQINHQQQSAQLTAIVYTTDNLEQQRILKRLESITNQIHQPAKPIKYSGVTDNELKVLKTDQQYADEVTLLKQHIAAGDIFQVVPSRIFTLPCPQPLAAYHELKLSNPSPYMFFMQDQDFCLFGASPESALKFTAANRQIEIYPIAGTRPRGKHADGSIDLDLDCRLELDLRLNQKEMAEHIMLVDLARNDLARICVPGSRYVADLTKVDRYSHVMHLVSRVVATLRPELDALHGYRASMNMGTLTGAPKVRAMQLITQIEQQRRGSYAGAIGYLNASGDLDSCIVIRSAYVEDGVAYIQAGAGVVMDSDPQAEAQETRQKAQAVIQAISKANQAKENN